MRCFTLKRSIKHGFISSLEKETKEYRRKSDMLYPHCDTATGEQPFLKPCPVWDYRPGAQATGHKEERTNCYFAIYTVCLGIFTSGHSQPTYDYFSCSTYHFIFFSSRSCWNCPDLPPLHRVTRTSKKCSLSILTQSFKILSTSEVGVSCEEWGATAIKCCLKWILMRTHSCSDFTLCTVIDTLLCSPQHSGQTWTKVRTIQWMERSLWL